MALPLPDCQETQVFRLITQLLQSSTDLQRVVKTWCVFDGSSDEVQDWTKVQLPFIALAPDCEQADPITEGLTSVPFVIGVYLVVDGTEASDFLNLWDAIRRAIYKGDNAVQQQLSRLRATGCKMVRPSYTALSTPDGRKVLEGEGAFVFPTLVSTHL